MENRAEAVVTELDNKLNIIKSVFNIEDLANRRFGSKDVVDYYVQSDYGYRRFHSTEGSIHMALNFDQEFREEGYYGQAKIVQKHLTEIAAQDVLELACGKGFNTIYLAGQNKDAQFTGIDLTPKHVHVAQRESQGLANARFCRGNFQNLPFEPASFDLIFVVESICHATDMRLALSEVRRVLRPNGRFIVFDGFRRPGFHELSSDLQLASKLVEASMAVDQPWIITEWLAVAQEQGFHIDETKDLSQAVMPNLLRFERLADKFFKRRFVTHLLLRILPSYLVKNSIAGLLMSTTIRAGAHSYQLIVLTERGAV